MACRSVHSTGAQICGKRCKASDGARSAGPGADNPKFEKTFSDFQEYYEAHCNDNTAPYDGIMELLKELKLNGIKLAIVSNKLDRGGKGLNRYFKGI